MINLLIFLAGLVIYAGYGLGGLCYILIATALSYLAGFFVRRYRWVMPLAVGVNVLALLLCKLQPVTGMALVAPLGISYFTLQIISYLVDISRGKLSPERDPLRYGLYITYLPHIFFGPIMGYEKMSAALFQDRRITWEDFLLGSTRLLWGVCKRLVIAARAGLVIGTITADPEAYRGAYALAAMVLYSLQLYCDFSGGMDMVLGVSRMLGIRLAENFDAPYFSQSIQEFWRRWHITLGAWLREYVYIPLGGNRKGKARKGLNLVVTFLVSGLWHGIHYLLWGLLHGIGVALGDKLKTRWVWLNRLGTCLVVTLLWAFFVWSNTPTALSMLGSVFTTFNYTAFFAGLSALGLTLGDWIVLFAATALLAGYDAFARRINSWLSRCTPAGKLAVIGALALVALVFGMYGLGFQAQDFIYSRF